jgi:hypothetical protein
MRARGYVAPTTDDRRPGARGYFRDIYACIARNATGVNISGVVVVVVVVVVGRRSSDAR